MKKILTPTNAKKEEQYTTLFHNRWISLRETRGYVYSTETRANANLVAILIHDSSRPGQVLGRYEKCPAHFDEIALASFTGGVEEGNALATAVMEIREESGYTVDTTDVVFLGTCRPSKSADTVVHLFAVDVNSLTPGDITGDGSEGEVGAYAEWVSYSEAFKCKDPLMSILLGRFLTNQGQFDTLD